MIARANNVTVTAVWFAVDAKVIEDAVHVSGQFSFVTFLQCPALQLLGELWTAGVVFEQAVTAAVQRLGQFCIKAATVVDQPPDRRRVRWIAQRPQRFAIDTTVMPFIVIMVALASILGTVFSARRIVKRKAVEILRMS